MSKLPSKEIWSVLCDAASQAGVSATLLAAIAWCESRYDPKAVSIRPNKDGSTDLGLMQLSAAVIEQYGVTDWRDPRQSATAAAQYLARLTLATDKNPSNVIAAYNWGLRRVNEAQDQKKPWPAVVSAYVEQVQECRRELQSQDKPEGASIFARLQNAIAALAKLNPGVELVQRLDESFRSYAPVADNEFAGAPVLLTAWWDYARLYEVAPITSLSSVDPAQPKTPTPRAVLGDAVWHAVTALGEPETGAGVRAEVVRPVPGAVLTAQQRAAEGGKQSENGPGALVVLVGFAVWFYLTHGSRQ